MWRRIFGVAAGLLAAMLIIMGMEKVSAILYPLPEGVDPTDYHQLAAYMEHVPIGALQFVLAGWTLGSFFCGLIIGLIIKSKSKIPTIIAGVLLLSTAIVNLFLYPHPTWFRVVSVFVFIPAAYIGHWLANQLLIRKKLDLQ